MRRIFFIIQKNLRENLGLKIGLITGVTVILTVLLLVGVFGAIQISLISKFSMIQILLTLGILIAGFSILVISISTNLLVQRPLLRLIDAIHQAETGNLKAQADVSSEDEIGQVSTQFNEMLGKIHDLERNKLDTQRLLTVAQEELKFKKVLEEKAQIIASTNRKLEESLNELSVLYNISQGLTGSIDPEELCNLLGDGILKNIPMEDFAIMLMNEESKQLEVKSALGFKQEDSIRELIFDLNEGVCGKVAKTKRLVYIANTSIEPKYLHYKGAKPENGSFLSIPLVAKNLLLGVMNFSRSGIDAFSNQEIRLLQAIGSQVAMALENARLYAKTKELSLTDELTKVYNRRHFQKMIEMEYKRTKRFHRALSLMMIDVDYFKKFNDTYGHLEGDKILVELADRLSDNLREVDTVARYGGEEFSVLLPNTNLEEAEKVANKLREVVRSMPVNQRNGMGLQVTVSIGVAALDANSDSTEDLINHADIALYQAKASGRDMVRLYIKSEHISLRAVE